jgi:hypothetical protein
VLLRRATYRAAVSRNALDYYFLPLKIRRTERLIRLYDFVIQVQTMSQVALFRQFEQN